MKYIKHFVFGGIMSLFVMGSLFLITRYPSSWILFILSFATPMFLLLSFYFFVKKTRKWKEPIGFLTPLLFISQMLLVEIIDVQSPKDLLVQRFVILFAGLLFGILYGAGVSSGEILSSLQKPYRRFVMAAWVYTVYGFCSFIFALPFFLTLSPLFFVILLLVGGGLLGGVSSFVWQMYFAKPKKVFFLWMILVGFLGMQLLWALHFLPLGYLNLGLFMTWIWYLLILLARFHWDENGVEWKKQFRFLLTNTLLLIIIIVYFVRWI